MTKRYNINVIIDRALGHNKYTVARCIKENRKGDIND